MVSATCNCAACGTAYPADRLMWRCPCGGALDLAPGPGLGRGEIAAGEASLWRYAAALAVAAPPRVSLGEGWTALVRRRWHGAELYFKLESQMPTGSFKDRGTAVVVNHLLALGVGPVHEDSSGNAGASLAAYAAAAGLECRIFVPAAAPPGKIVQIAATGAELRTVPGSREDVTAAALAFADSGESFYASHNWHPFFIEGTKTLAYELWEQLGFAVPDNILVPTGYGSNVLGLARGFAELQVAKPPRLFAVQAANCAALVAAAAGTPFRPVATVADGIATVRPVRPAAVLAAVRGSGGAVVAVPEAEIGPAVLELGRLGLYVEPTAATAAAAARRLLADGTIRPGETTVVVLTGHGLKAGERIGDLLSAASGDPRTGRI